ncbi:phosphodiester glycosidase family protein [Alkaliphilus hydrothermalis]|uniref:Exopolysaccharide biosynthesis protein n=1 Tax=Alkaliphilus hydrothermalis TaxID=1482730 RepID=A0ABS2NMS8_9FIRM|nr:phosphodiester glycosidase family protein [Alkaliphilus hydrothermalis]MBM7614251.1 exopolysaccharide biosynthesis protein [Alkaliphilus hydrothermalis]
MSLQKKRIWTGIFSIILLLSLTVGANANSDFYEKITTERLSSGVTQKHIQRFTKDGWLNVNALYVDLNDETIELDLLQSSGGVSTKETLTSMVKRKENVVGAMNGDFFYMTNPDSPMGIMLKDGKMISSPVIANELATFYINRYNNAFADYLDYYLKLKTDKGKELKVAAINKITSKYQYITVIDKNWGPQSLGVAEDRQDLVEVLVVDNKVVEVRKSQPSVNIPANGYIVMATGFWGAELMRNINVGDVLTIETLMIPGVDSMKLALGGGTLLVKNGQVVPFTQSVTGNHPRSAVGITKNRSQIILVTVDGRHSSYVGVNGDSLAKLMIELGSHEAVIMDGGGSSTMLTRRPGSFVPQLTNTPSDGSERRIINGLAIISNAIAAPIQGIKAEASNQNVFKDTAVEVSVVGFDTNYNPIKVDTSKIKYSLKSGGGNFTGNKFIPNKSGKAVIAVEYLGKTTEVEVKVLEEPANLEITPNSLTLSQGKTASFKVTGVDALGYRAPINPQQITWKDLEGLGTIKDGVYTAGNSNGEGTLVAEFKNSKLNIPVAVGNQQVILDNFNEMKVRFNSYPQGVTGSISLVDEGRQNTDAVALEYDFTTTEATRGAYMDYPNGGITISGKPLKLGVWVSADQQSTQWIRGRIYDGNGTVHTLDFKRGVDWTGWKYLEAALPANIAYPVKLDRVYVVEPNPEEKVKGRIVFDDLQAVYPIGSTIQTVSKPVIKDPLYKEAATKGNIITAHSGIALNQNTLMERYLVNNIVNKINHASNTALFTGNVEEGVKAKLKKPMVIASSGHSHQDNVDHLIIKLDNRQKGLRQTNFSQWPYLKSQLENTKKNNIFIVLPNPIWGTNGFSDGLEAKLFEEMLTKEAEKGKNIFVLYGGEALKVDLKNGVRYISTGTNPKIPPKSPHDTYQYLEFNVSGNTLTYQIKSIFK